MSGKLVGTLHDSTIIWVLSLLTALLVMASAIVTIVLSFHDLSILRAAQLVWNVCFGVTIAIPHIRFLMSVAELVGFVHTW